MKQKFKYLKFSYILVFFICQNSVVSFSQYYSTTAINLIDSLRLGKEGDLYLDTLNENYKIGLSNGKLGSLSDKQDIDSITITNDSLFVHISNGKKAGTSINFTKPSYEKGLQVFVWNINNTNQPNIDNRRQWGAPTYGTITLDSLGDSLHQALSLNYIEGYFFKFMGTLIVKNSGIFNFTATSDDGSRIDIDDLVIVDNWFNQAPTSISNGVWLAKGEHKISFWYYQDNGSRYMSFQWGANPDGYIPGSLIKGDQFYVK